MLLVIISNNMNNNNNNNIDVVDDDNFELLFHALKKDYKGIHIDTCGNSLLRTDKYITFFQVSDRDKGFNIRSRYNIPSAES